MVLVPEDLVGVAEKGQDCSSSAHSGVAPGSEEHVPVA